MWGREWTSKGLHNEVFLLSLFFSDVSTGESFFFFFFFKLIDQRDQKKVEPLMKHINESLINIWDYIFVFDGQQHGCVFTHDDDDVAEMCVSLIPGQMYWWILDHF